jgi:hypothetical protein
MPIFSTPKETVVYCAAFNSSLPRKHVSKLYENPCPELKKNPSMQSAKLHRVDDFPRPSCTYVDEWN